MLLTRAAVFSHWNHGADKNSRLKAAKGGPDVG